ncbi:hypothetical protein F5Y15DRAFT_340770 [Xylariaceae sp. FL0016]|nr:hypothetical protein F5Y15DRAFT_340770 [Xylariaceae sp. FL0016]
MAEPQSLLVQFFQEHYSPIRERMFLAIDAPSLLMLSGTCQALRTGIHTLWDINRRLRRFFDEPAVFRSKLAQCDALICGSFALQFFEGVYWKESGLDIKVKYGKNVKTLHDFVINEAGYTLSDKNEEWVRLARDKDQSQRDEYHRVYVGFVAESECRTYYRRNATSGVLKVQLIVTWEIPLHIILRRYYTSCFLNFITWDAAYSMFPRTTFGEHKTIQQRASCDQREWYRAKYRERGFVMAISPTHAGLAEWGSKFDGQHYPRRVGDRRTWTMRLDTEGVTPSSTPTVVFETHTFAISHKLEWNPLKLCRIEANLINSQALEHTYIQWSHCTAWVKLRGLLRNSMLDQLQRPDPEQYQKLTGTTPEGPDAPDFVEVDGMTNIPR